MFAALLDGTSDAVFVVGEAGHLVHANRQALDRLGYTQDDLLQLRRAGVFARGTDEILSLAVEALGVREERENGRVV